MRSIFLALSISLIAVSCNQEEETDIESRWHLVEQLADPGDGSGTFQPVNSEKILEFFEDETISSNGSLCNMTTDVGNGSTGTYNFQDSTITVDGCGFGPPYPMTFETDGDDLILNYPCIEPCREKYERID